jgi:hypothetical protein
VSEKSILCELFFVVSQTNIRNTFLKKNTALMFSTTILIPPRYESHILDINISFSFISNMFEFIIGGVFGVYIAQTCVVPNLQEKVTNWILNQNHTITIPPTTEEEEKEDDSFTGEMPKIPTQIEMTRTGLKSPEL